MLTALRDALEACQQERKDQQTPARADIDQLIGRYVYDHIEMVLKELIHRAEDAGCE